MNSMVARLGALALGIGMALPVAAAEIGDDGLHKAAWFRDTFKDIREDFADAKAEDKRLLLIIEQRGCIYCTRMHEETFPDARVRTLLEERFFPIQINLHGDTEVTDADGEILTEKSAMRKWRIMFTPTLVFLPPDLDPGRSAVDQAVSVMPGAFGPGTTLDMMNWVLEERYLTELDEDFQRYHARMIRERSDGNTE